MGVATPVAQTGMAPTTGSQSQFVPIARNNAAQLQSTQTQTTFDVSQLTADQLTQLQRFMQQNAAQAAAQQAQQQQAVQQQVTATFGTPVVQQTVNKMFSDSAAMSMPTTQQQQLMAPQTTAGGNMGGGATTTTGVEQQLLEQQKMTQKLQDQLKAMQTLQNNQQLAQHQSLAQQLQQFESVQRGSQQPQLNQMPATSLAKSNEQPQRVSFQQMQQQQQQQQGAARASLPTQNTLTMTTNNMQLPTTMNNGQQTMTTNQQTMPTTMSTAGQTMPTMNTAQQTMQPTANTVQQQMPTGQMTGSQVPQQTSQFQQVQQIPSQQSQTVSHLSTTGVSGMTGVREDICATAQPGDLFAHPNDPTQFVICYGFGEFTVMDCPDMLVYNDHLKRCDVNTELPLLCKSNPCLNNGKCSEINSVSFKCECNSGFGGQFCEKLDTCSTRPCGTDGVCIPFVLGSPVAHVCLCNGGRTVGVNCQKVEQNPCLTPGSNLRLLSVSFNPSVFAHCEGSRPHFKFCQPPLIFSNAKQTCEWA
jgi:hypothetical protein